MLQCSSFHWRVYKILRWQIYLNLHSVLLGEVANNSNLIFCLKGDLRDMIDPDFGLLEKLMNKEVLTDAERQNVETKSSFQERNDTLLSILLRKDDAAQQRFISCLRDTDQDHVYNFIQWNGGK